MADHMPTTQDILEAVNVFAADTEKRFTDLRQDLKREITTAKIEVMDHTDDKLADLKGDLVILMRKEDKKVTELIRLLTRKRILNNEEEKQLLALEPFPQII